MNRVATIPMQRNLSEAIQRSQQKLSATQLQLANGKKALDYASLGTETVRHLSARTMVARHEAHSTVSKRLTTTLAIYDANLTAVDTAVGELRNEVLAAVGTRQSTGLQEAIEQAFHQFRSSMNADEAGLPLFAGSRTDERPFKPAQLSDTIGLDPADAFSNDKIKASGRVSDGIDVDYGMLADEVGTDLFMAFRKLAEAGPIGDILTEAQVTALQDSLETIDGGLRQLRAASADNGRKQQQVETLGTRATDRTILLQGLISENEDADLGQVAVELAQQQTTLRASFSVFSQLSTMTLSEYLR
jgi:flagellar hook-associated protein 3 FlgL